MGRRTGLFTPNASCREGLLHTEDTPKQAPLNPESPQFMFQVGASQGAEEQRKHDV